MSVLFAWVTIKYFIFPKWYLSTKLFTAFFYGLNCWEGEMATLGTDNNDVVFPFKQLLGEPGSGGSSTPSMVGSVKQWQRSDPQESMETCKRLGEANRQLEMQLRMLHKLAEEWETYKFVIQNCSSLPCEQVFCTQLINS